MRTDQKTNRVFQRATATTSKYLPSKQRRRGFTLTEIMIAMGVLAVGMGMVAGALHAGIQTHIRTIDDIMRQLIGDNALAIVQATVRHSDLNGITDQYRTEGNGKAFIDARNLKFPFDDNTSPYGASVFIKTRPVEIGTSRANEYDVMIVPYRIIPLSETTSYGVASPRTMTSCTISTSGSVSKITVSSSNAQYLSVGSAIIDIYNGQASIIKSKQSDTVYVLADKMTKTGTTTVTTLVPPGGSRLECSKPVQTKTALTPQPMWAPGN